MTQQDGDHNPSRNIENSTDNGLDKEDDQLIMPAMPCLSALVFSPTHHEWTSAKNAERKTHATSQELLELAADSAAEAFVAWTPAKRVIRKDVIGPDGKQQSCLPEVESMADQVIRTASLQVSALMRTLGLAHYWQRLLRERRMASVKEIAKAEGLSIAQVNRVLRLALLAPAIIEWLIGSNDSVVLEDVMTRPWPSCWATQLRSVFETDADPGGPWNQLSGS